MKKIRFLFVLFLVGIINAQTVTIKGKSERIFKNGIKIAPALNQKYMNTAVLQDSTIVKNGQFSFQLKKTNDTFYYPYVFAEAINSNSFYTSLMVCLNSQTTELFIDKDFKVSYADKNSTISKYLQNYNSVFSDSENRRNQFGKPIIEAIQTYGNDKVPQEFWDNYDKENEKLEIEENQILKDFVQKNPSSVVGFWQTVSRFERFGYETVFEEIEKYFAPSIKKENPAKVFRKNLFAAKILNIGQTFPVPKITNTDKSAAAFQLPKAKYTLVDFWFSYCKPCLEEFPKMKELYSKYNDKGFEIVGIATDRSQDINHLQKIIEENHLNWKIYLDENSKQSFEWTITAVPMKYLLDENGKIISKNISLENLEKLLSENL